MEGRGTRVDNEESSATGVALAAAAVDLGRRIPDVAELPHAQPPSYSGRSIGAFRPGLVELEPAVYSTHIQLSLPRIALYRTILGNRMTNYCLDSIHTCPCRSSQLSLICVHGRAVALGLTSVA